MPSAPRPSAPSTYEVRRVRPEEWAQHRELRLRALRTDPLAFGSTLAREEAFPESTWRERTQRSATSAESSLFVAASREGDGAWAGMSVASLMEGKWHIFGMWVAPQVRGQGLGGRLLDAALDFVRARSPEAEVHLQVNPRQVPALRLYEGRGFVRTGSTEALPHAPEELVEAMVLHPVAGGPARTDDL